MKVKIHRRAIKFLDQLDEKRRNKIIKILNDLKNFPLIGKYLRRNLRKIGKRTYRIRIGNVRIVFDYLKEDDIIYIKNINFRGKVYKSL